MNSTLKLAPKLFIALTIVCVGAALYLVLPQLPPKVPAAVRDTPRHQLVEHNGRWYRNGEASPFTGCMVDYYPGGTLLARSQISNGLLNGMSETWYTNGQMQMREHFKKGVSQGLREKWHENGTKLSQAMIVEGKVTGTFRSWYDNGQLSEQIEMKLGKADGVAWAYYPSGFLKAETTVTDGQVLARQTWKDGERKPEPP